MGRAKRFDACTPTKVEYFKFWGTVFGAISFEQVFKDRRKCFIFVSF